MYIYLNVYQHLTGAKLFMLHGNTWNYLTVCKQMTIVNWIIRNKYLNVKPFNMSFKSVLNKMFTNIILIHIWLNMMDIFCLSYFLLMLSNCRIDLIYLAGIGW